MAKSRNEPIGDTATARRGRPRSVETTNAILESAYTLMATTGLAATSIDAVARHSNVSKMTIYKWWPSREALLIDAFLNQASLMLPLSGTGKPAARFRRHAAAYAEALQGEFGRAKNSAAEFRALGLGRPAAGASIRFIKSRPKGRNDNEGSSRSRAAPFWPARRPPAR